MAEKDESAYTREELEEQDGEPLPPREVMSIISTKPGLIAIPTDPTLPVDEDNPNA